MNNINHTHLQNFYEIINYTKDKYEKEPLVINLIHNIRWIWENNKSMWFSHEDIPLMPLIFCNYDNSIGIKICLLLHYDQIYRHPNKFINNSNKKYAFKFATNIAFNIIHDKEYNSLKDWEKVFTLLALRHNKNLNMKMLALKKTYKLLEEEQNNSLYLRFLKATIWDIHNFKQENIGYTNKGYNDNNSLNYELRDIKNHSEISNILQKSRTKEEILYNKPKNYISCIERNIKNEIMKIIEKQDSKKYAVSISGGVDSMILSYIVNKVCKTLNKELLLLHISYGNRDCCNTEIELLEIWAKAIEVPLYIRNIDEIKRSRSSNFRNLYEEITRKIRFSFYAYFNCPIFLGHNKDDCYENMFSNLSKRIHYDNLVGVKNISNESNIYILRPLINTMKQEIYDYADYNEIPHLYDSTPDWSNRGKMRDILIPGINKFDKELLPGLYEYSKYTTFLENQWKISFNKWVGYVMKNNNVNDDNTILLTDKVNIVITKDDFFNSNYMNLNFWIQLWFKLKMPSRPSNKSFNNLINHINIQKKNRYLCMLNQYYKIMFNSNTLTIMNV